ncbi:MAG: zf-HC2 domain-containing protein [Candidatus Eisenbacteria bacterium]|uniref:Zf-HC2 domain-containing protein n=1 Tax=Eiseniibacteriota bacterium TaxID=2212470 RepID=A0A538U215_UNCEI|nr:MAG: zf-HC2 domain-containing protein [Candidatus Eisenbacteria bacterium]
MVHGRAPWPWPDAEKGTLEKIDCDQVLDQLSEYLDEEMRAELCEAIKEHLARCQDCKVMVDSVRKTIVLYQKHSTIELPMQATVKLSAALAREYGREPGRAD